ncbi:MAG: TIGR03016 family PEP-CTERM system-associated outer membrane protein [Alphaproteobacteria bacterium]
MLTPAFGYGNPAVSPLLSPNPGPSTALSNPLSTTTLAPVRPGAFPLQAGDPRAPAILLQPSVSLLGGYTDNPRNTPNNFSDVFGQFHGDATISVDTVRLQGQLSGSLDHQRYARATDQNQTFGNLLAYGLGTVVTDHVFIDGRAAITETSQTGGLAFASPSLIPNSQAQQVITASVSPFARQSFGGYVDSELRYNYSTVQTTSGNSAVNANPSPLLFAPNLQDATQNAVTATFATGQLLSVVGSRLTLDARKIDSVSAARSTQYRAFDDLSYQFNPKFAGLGRIGYENLDYPFQPSANFNGPSWYIGGRYTPYGSTYVLLTFGRQEGLLGFNGALQYEITPRTTAFASFQRNRVSQQQQIFNSLNASGVDSFGNVVNQSTGLPVPLVNSVFSNTNAVTENETAQAGVQTRFERDTLSLYTFIAKESPIGAPIGVPLSSVGTLNNTGGGANLIWGRSLTPRLNSYAALGFTRQTNDDQNTLTASWSLQYILGEKLSANFLYQFINVDSSAVGSSYHRNQVQIGLTRSF